MLGKPDAKGRNRIPLPMRMLSSALVLACALLLWRGESPKARRGQARGLVAAGMGCGFIGDLVLAEVIPLPGRLLSGMLVFGVGHVLYIRAFSQQAHALAPRPARRTALGAAWAVALAGWWLLVRRSPVGPTSAHKGVLLQYGALAYALLLGSMSGVAASLAVQDRQDLPLALGGALFFASDMLLAGELFGDARFPLSGDVIWLTYIAGQGLIVSTIGLAN